MKPNIENRYKIMVLLLIIVNVMIVFTWWYLDHRNIGGKEHKRPLSRDGFKMDLFEATLKLDKDQSSQIQTLNRTHFKNLSELNNDIDSLKLLIKNEIKKPPHNELIINELFAKIAQKRTSIDTTIYYHFKRLRLVCNPDQLAPFDSLMNTFFMKRDRIPEFRR